MINEEFIVSVVIPAFKEGKTIQKVIRDIKSSSSYNTQIIVVDGYSNDGTEEIVKEENVDFVTEPRVGYGRAIKTGIDHAKGDIVVIIDADNTAWTPADLANFYFGCSQGLGNKFLGDIHSMMIFPYLLTPRMVADLRHNRINSIGEV